MTETCVLDVNVYIHVCWSAQQLVELVGCTERHTCRLTVKSKVNVGREEKHEEGIESNVGVVDPAAEEVPFVVNKGSHQWVFE